MSPKKKLPPESELPVEPNPDADEQVEPGLEALPDMQ